MVHQIMSAMTIHTRVHSSCVPTNYVSQELTIEELQRVLVQPKDSLYRQYEMTFAANGTHFHVTQVLFPLLICAVCNVCVTVCL